GAGGDVPVRAPGGRHGRLGAAALRRPGVPGRPGRAVANGLGGRSRRGGRGVGRPCSVCGRPDPELIDQAILAGVPYRNILARCSGISLGGLARHRAHVLPTAPLPPVDGGWQLILADPPWRFEVRDRATGLGRSADTHYPTMPLADICALPV